MIQLPNGKFRITNTATGQTLDINAADLPKYGLGASGSSGGSSSPSFDLKTTAANLAPTAASMIGQIVGGTVGAGGGVVGGAVAGGGPEDVPADVAGGFLGERVGQTAGGALGQSFGEWLKNTILGKKTTAGDLAKNAVEGGLYANIPGGKLLTRAVGGGAVSAGAQAVQDFNPSKKNFGESANKLETAAGEGAAANVVIPAAFDAAKGIVKFAGQDVPQDIYKVVQEEPKKVEGALYSEVQSKLVGHNNVQYAVQHGILKPGEALTSETINSALDRTSQKASDIAKQEEAILGKEESKVPAGNVLPGLVQIAKDNGLAFTGKAGKTYTDKVAPILSQVRNILFSELNKGASVLENKSGPAIEKSGEEGVSTAQGSGNSDRYVLQGGKTGKNGVTVGGKLVKVAGKDLSSTEAQATRKVPYSGSTSNNASGIISGTDKITLSSVLKAKRLLANYYNDNPVYKQMYSYLKDFIETESGVPDEIRSLEQESHVLSSMKQQLTKWKNLEGSLPSNLTPEAISEAVSSAKQGKSKKLQNLLGWITLTGELGGYAGGKFMGYLFGKGATSTTEKMMETPEGQMKIAKFLQNLGTASSRAYNLNGAGGNSMNLQKLLTQLGVRAASSH